MKILHHLFFMPVPRQTLSLILCDGYHRSAAFFELYKSFKTETETVHGTPGWCRGGKLRNLQDAIPEAVNIGVLYLGPFSERVFINTALALNHGNSTTYPLTFFDQLNVVDKMMWVPVNDFPLPHLARTDVRVSTMTGFPI